MKMGTTKGYMMKGAANSFVPNIYYPTDQIPLFEDFVETFFKDKQNLSPDTLDFYHYYCDRFLIPNLSGKRLDQIYYTDIQSIINLCATMKVGKDVRNLASSILGHATNDLHILMFNIASASYIYPDPAIYDEEYWGITLDDFEQIIWWLEFIKKHAPGSDLEKEALLCLGMGLRPSEGFGTDGSFFDMENRILWVQESFTDFKGHRTLHKLKTSTSHRALPMYDYIYNRVAELGIYKGPWVLNSYGKRSRDCSLNKKLARFRKKHGLPRLTLEGMRGSFATAALNSGMPVKYLQLWLGHSNPATTLSRYTRTKPAQLAKSASRFDEIIKQVLSSNEVMNSDKPPKTLTLMELMHDHAMNEGSPTPKLMDEPPKQPHMLHDSLSERVAPNDPNSAPKIYKEIKELMHKNPKITLVLLAAQLNVSRDTIKRRVKEMQVLGIVSHEGSTRAGRWIA